MQGYKGMATNRRKSVVGRLAHVNMVIWMHTFAAHLQPKYNTCPVCYNLTQDTQDTHTNKTFSANVLADVCLQLSFCSSLLMRGTISFPLMQSAVRELAIQHLCQYPTPYPQSEENEMT